MYHQQYPPYYPPQQPQHHGLSNVTPRDPLLAMRKDEERRKQQEYALALAQQVQQRDMRRQQERDLDRQAPGPTAIGANGFHQPYHEDPMPAKGMFDGLGQNQPRTNFARGQRTQPQAQSYSQQPMPGFVQKPSQLPPENRTFQMDAGGAFGHPFDPQLPLYPQGNAMPMFPVPIVHDQHNGGYPLMHQPSGFQDAMRLNHQDTTQQQQFQRPPTSDHYQSQPQQQGGRRIRTDINGSDAATDERAKQKLQQQQAMQLALQRQVEEKKRQKLEEKQRQDEEDRKEMERFEAEKRRLELEKERLREEKRRKAEEEAVKATQQHATFIQQTKAAAKTTHRQQHPTRLSFEKQNPFVNSRAKLFEEPERSPVHINNNFEDKREQQRVFAARPTAYEPPAQSVQHFEQPQMRGPMEMHPVGHHDQRMGPPQMDMTTLLRCYDEIKQELIQQKQMVEQLRQAHASIQQQQHQQQQPPNGVLTISDLEELRQELHEELEHRQYIHQQEVAELKRHQQQQQERRSLNQVAQESIEDSDRRGSHTYECRSQQRTSEHYAATSPKPNHRQQRDSASSSPFKTNTRNSITPPADQMLCKSFALKDPIDADDSVPSFLPCDSKLVYFNGHVADSKSASLPPHLQLDPLEGDSMDRFIIETELEAGAKRYGSPPPIKDSLGRGIKALTTGNNRNSHADLVQNADNLEDSLDFFVDDFQLHPHDSHLETSETVTKSANKMETHFKEPSRNNRYEFGSINSSHSPWKSRASLGRSYEVPLSLHGQDDIVIDEGESDQDDTDDIDLDSLSLDGPQLTAIFQRNVRRYEILRGFEATNQGQPPRRTAWNQLHQLLEANSNNPLLGSKHEHKPEESLVASTRWLPSSVLTDNPNSVSTC